MSCKFQLLDLKNHFFKAFSEEEQTFDKPGNKHTIVQLIEYFFLNHKDLKTRAITTISYTFWFFFNCMYWKLRISLFIVFIHIHGSECRTIMPMARLLKQQIQWFRINSDLVQGQTYLACSSFERVIEARIKTKG